MIHVISMVQNGIVGSISVEGAVLLETTVWAPPGTAAAIGIDFTSTVVGMS